MNAFRKMHRSTPRHNKSVYSVYSDGIHLTPPLPESHHHPHFPPLRQAPRQIRHQMIDELPHLGGEVAVAGVDGPDGGVPVAEGVQHRDQFAAGQVLLHVVVGQLGQAQALEGGVKQGGAGVGPPLALHANLPAHAFHLEQPGVAAADQAAVVAELGQAMRARDLLEVAPGAHHVFAALAQAPGDQRRVLEHPHAHGDIVALVDQLHLAVGEVHLHFQLRVQALEVVDQGRHEALAEGGSGGQLEYPLGAGLEVGDRRLGLAEAVEQVAAVLIVEGAGIGEADLPGGAVEQLSAQLVLELAHQAADMGVGDLQMARRRREGAQAHHFDEGFDTVPTLHGGRPLG